MHHDSSIDEESEFEKKPDIITFYNKTKIGVDLVDQKIQKYNVARTTYRWPTVVFYNLINLSGINAHVIFNNNLNANTSRSDFLEKIGWELVKPQIEKRSQIPNIFIFPVVYFQKCY